MKPLKLIDVTFTDGISSFGIPDFGASLATTVLHKLDDVGYDAIEAWGGTLFASYLSGFRFEEDGPWARLRAVKSVLKKTPLQVSVYGRYMAGTCPYPDDMVKFFTETLFRNGVDIISVADPLNNIDHLKTTLEVANQMDKRVSAGIVITPETLSDTASFGKVTALAQELEKQGAYAIELRDTAGILPPYTAYQLIRCLRGSLASVKTRISLRTSNCTGMGNMTVMQAAEAGVDTVATVLSPVCSVASPPAAESVITALHATAYSTELTAFLCKDAVSLLRSAVGNADTSTVCFPVTGSLYTGNTRDVIPGELLPFFNTALADAALTERYDDVTAELCRIRSELGDPPLLSPVCEMLMAQAILNVLSEKRYEIVNDEFVRLVRGDYGKLPKAVSPELSGVVRDTVPKTRFAETEEVERIVGSYYQDAEDTLTYNMFPRLAMAFFRKRHNQKYGLDDTANPATRLYNAY